MKKLRRQFARWMQRYWTHQKRAKNRRERRRAARNPECDPQYKRFHDYI